MVTAQQTRDFRPMLGYCCVSVAGVGGGGGHDYWWRHITWHMNSQHWSVTSCLVNDHLKSVPQVISGNQVLSNDHVQRRHETLNQCWFNVDPEAETMGQHWIDIGSLRPLDLRIIACVCVLLRVWCWLSVVAGGPIINQYRFNVSLLVSFYFTSSSFCVVNYDLYRGGVWLLFNLINMFTITLLWYFSFFKKLRSVF